MSKKVIIITGASSGIGKATAKKLISEGHTVYAGARRVENMQDLKEMGGKIISLDVTDNPSIENFVNQVIQEEGKIDVLFNNAGFGLYGPVEDLTIDQARHQFEVNLFGLARITQLVIPQMREQGSGKIINTSSMGGKIYTPLGAWYHATKHALEGWSDCLRLELKGFGIDVVIIEPGAIETGFGDEVLKGLPEKSKSGPYAPIIEGVLAAFAGGSIKPSSADVIAGVVSKAISSKKPKTRYLAGAMSHQLIWIRRLLGDRGYDKVVGGMMGVK
jgi:short-subunit dehydrogenase